MPSRRRNVPGSALGSRTGSGSRPNLHAATQPGPLRRDSPFGATRILIDGRNVQRALERGAAPGSMPTATLVARLRAAFAPPTEVELILDGHAGPTPTGRIAPELQRGVRSRRERGPRDRRAGRRGVPGPRPGRFGFGPRRLRRPRGEGPGAAQRLPRPGHRVARGPPRRARGRRRSPRHLDRPGPALRAFRADRATNARRAHRSPR